MDYQPQQATPLELARERRTLIKDCRHAFTTVSSFVQHLRRTASLADNPEVQGALREIASAHARLAGSWTQMRTMCLEDEKRAAVAGGRAAMAHGTHAATPLTSVLCLGVCAAAFGMVIVTAIRGNGGGLTLQRQASDILTAVDIIIDRDLCGLSRQRLQEMGLIARDQSGAEQVTQPNLRTADGIKATINHARSMWRQHHPLDSPLEEYMFVVQAAIGRAAVAPPAGLLSTGTSEEVSGYREDLLATKETRLGTAFYCDMWLHMASMLGRRAAVLADLEPIPPVSPISITAATTETTEMRGDGNDWTADEAEKAHYLATGTRAVLCEAVRAAAGDGATGVKELYILEKKALVEWAAVAGQIAAADDLLRQVIQISDRSQLWPGDRELHAAYAAGDDDRPAAILAWKTAGAGSDEQTAGVSDPIVILRTQDVDSSVMAAACLLRILTQEYQNVSVTELAVDTLCVHWDDQLEASGVSATLFTVPSLVQIHNFWVVTFEGVRTEPMLFSAAIRTWLFACVRMEQLDRLPFSITMLLQRMQRMRH